MSDEQIDYNILSEFGTTDQEYVNDHGAPQDLVGTPKINDWMVEKMYTQNIEAEYEAAINTGASKQEAMSRAKKIAEKGKASARGMIADVRKRRGY